MNDQILTARKWLAQKPVFLDTETTGLDDQAEACQIAVVDHDGTVLLDTLVCPVHPIPAKTTAIHGITNADVVNAPTFVDIRGQLRDLLSSRLVVIYNAAYDLRILEQSARARGLEPHPSESTAACAMLWYADYRGQWDGYHQNNRWFKLETACALERVPTDGITAHHAAADCELTRRLARAIALRKLPYERAERKVTA